MGIRGPAPNPERDQRERKNGWITLPNVPTDGPLPVLVGEHTARGVKQWGRWWATPMAAMWSPYDADALERLLDLYELHWLADPKRPANLGEIRQLEDRYGLTPASRRRLMWMIDGVDTISKASTGAAAPGEGLRVVAGGKDDPRRARRSG